MRRFAIASALAFALATGAAGCIIAGDDSSLTIENQSSYVLSEVYLADVDAPTWGRNLLPQPLFPGQDLILDDIDCGDYDVMVVDETGVTCELGDLDLCFDDEVWTVTDLTLDICAFAP